MTSRIQPSAAFWATMALVVVLVGYPLSFGPACWLMRRDFLSTQSAMFMYRPIVENSGKLPFPAYRAIEWFAGYSPERISTLMYLRLILAEEVHILVEEKVAQGRRLYD
jgi:hypothetical protein